MAKKKEPNKFRVEVLGKDSISEGVSKIAVARLEARGITYSADDHDAWDEALDAEAEVLREFVEKFVKDGSGGDDSCVLEFDLTKKTCKVVPVSEAEA